MLKLVTYGSKCPGCASSYCNLFRFDVPCTILTPGAFTSEGITITVSFDPNTIYPRTSDQLLKTLLERNIEAISVSHLDTAQHEIP